MDKQKFTIEHLLYFVALILALSLRLAHLGDLPLLDNEASLALQSLDISNGHHPIIQDQPGYVLSTGTLFFIFGSSGSNFLARLLPALIGSLFILSPFLFRKITGKSAAIIIAFGLALDPSQIAISRIADGKMFAIAFSIFATGFYIKRKPAWAGICTGLALLSGPSLLQGWLSIGIVSLVTILQGRFFARLADDNTPFLATEPFAWRKGLFWALGTMFFAGTLFFLEPGGISAAASSIPVFISGWTQTPTVFLSQVIMAVIAYESLVICLGIWSLVNGLTYKNSLDIFLARWFIISLLIILINPARQVNDLSFAILPVIVLASRQLSRLFPVNLSIDELLPTLSHGFLVFILLVFAGLNTAAIINSNFVQGSNEADLRLIAVSGSIILTLLITFLVGWGWSTRSAGYGLLVGISGFLALYQISATWNAAGLGRNPEVEIWHSGPVARELDLLNQTIMDHSEWHKGFGNVVDITLVDIDSPAIKWSLRNQKKVNFTNHLASEDSPSMIITQDNKNIALASNYAGQDFVISQQPAWSLMFPAEWLRWILYREAPLEKSNAILWVRSDIFPGSQPSVGQ